jgi:hypothetical protein
MSGGWRDAWHPPHEAPAALRAEAEATELQLLAQAAALGLIWREEIAAKRRQYAKTWRSRRARREGCPR